MSGDRKAHLKELHPRLFLTNCRGGEAAYQKGCYIVCVGHGAGDYLEASERAAIVKPRKSKSKTASKTASKKSGTGYTIKDLRRYYYDDKTHDKKMRLLDVLPWAVRAALALDRMLAEAESHDGRVVVHCRAGINRSVTTILMWALLAKAGKVRLECPFEGGLLEMIRYVADRNWEERRIGPTLNNNAFFWALAATAWSLSDAKASLLYRGALGRHEEPRNRDFVWRNRRHIVKWGSRTSDQVVKKLAGVVKEGDWAEEVERAIYTASRLVESAR